MIELLPSCEDVLDAGCGHGAFTIEMSKYTNHICAFDFAVEMIQIAEQLKTEAQTKNVDFFCATTKESLPFKPEQFDLIYDRRGPTSIINHIHLLKNDGLIFGIHSGELDLIKQRLNENGFSEIEITTYSDVYLCFPAEDDFARYLSASHMNPDYTLPENRDEFNGLLKKHIVNGEILFQQIRYVWSARKAAKG